MEVDAYFKVILSITTAYFFAIGLIAPNPILKRSERVKLGGVLENTDASGQHMCMGLAAFSVFLGISEIVSVFAGQSQLFLTRTQVLAAVLVIIGGSIRLWTFRALGKFFTFQIGVQKNQKLVKHGLYSIVRHPSYTGAMIFSHPGFLLWHLTKGSWVHESGILQTRLGWFSMWGLIILFIAIAYMICINRPPQEDEVMKKAFGKEWEEWARDVPYRIVPGIY